MGIIRVVHTHDRLCAAIDAGRIVCGKRLCNGTVSVRPSVCPIDRQRQRRAAGLLLIVYRSIPAASVNAVIRGGESTQTRYRRKCDDQRTIGAVVTVPGSFCLQAGLAGVSE